MHGLAAILSCCILIIAGLGSVGCTWRRAPVDPPAPITLEVMVFNDGFHSGFIVPYDRLGLRLDLPRVVRPPVAQARFVEVGFTERDWALWIDHTTGHVLGMLFRTSPGGVALRWLPTRERSAVDDRPRQVYRLALTARGEAAFRATVLDWLDPTPPALVPVDDPAFVLPASTRRYWLWRNCHDFTAEVLAAVGLPVQGSMVRTPSSFAVELERLFSAMEDFGLTRIEPGAWPR